MSNWKGFSDEILNNISETSKENNSFSEGKRNVKTASFTKSAKKTPTYKSQSKNENVNKPQKTIDDSQKMAAGIKKI